MKRIRYWCYRFIRFWVRLVYPKTEVVGLENLPDEPCLVVSNHCQMHGPIAAELYFPGSHYIWCAGEMTHLRQVPEYAYRDFWSHKSKAVRWFYKALSYLIAPISVCIFSSAHTVPVYHDKRILATFRQTLQHLQGGSSVVIFPEHDVPHDHILCQFQEGFVDVARSYYRQTGKCLRFVPMYLAPALHKMYLGEPVVFDPEAPIRQERTRICRELMERISATACSLPCHRVVPYRNVAKSQYPYNLKLQEAPYENTGG